MFRFCQQAYQALSPKPKPEASLSTGGAMNDVWFVDLSQAAQCYLYTIGASIIGNTLPLGYTYTYSMVLLLIKRNRLATMRKVRGLTFKFRRGGQ